MGEINMPSDDYVFVDGSFNTKTQKYGYGGVLIHGGKTYKLQGSGTDSEYAKMRNVAGEILGAQAGIEKAIELKIEKVTVIYDYLGIEYWARGIWKRNKKGTIAYKKFIDNATEKIEIHFKKVKSHSGIKGNDIADQLAKEAVDIK